MSSSVHLSESVLMTNAGAVPLSALTHVAAASAITSPAQTGVAAATTGATITTPYGYTGAAQADAIRVGVNACIVDIAALKVAVDAIRVALTAAGITA